MSLFNHHQAWQWRAGCGKYKCSDVFTCQVKAGFGASVGRKTGWSVLPLMYRQLTHSEDRMRFILAFFFFFNGVLTTAWPFILFFISLAILHSMQDLSSLTRIEPVSPPVGVLCLNHWTTRDISILAFPPRATLFILMITVKTRSRIAYYISQLPDPPL